MFSLWTMIQLWFIAIANDLAYVKKIIVPFSLNSDSSINKHKIIQKPVLFLAGHKVRYRITRNN